MRISDWSSDVCSSDLHHQHKLTDKRRIHFLDGLRQHDVCQNLGLAETKTGCGFFLPPMNGLHACAEDFTGVTRGIDRKRGNGRIECGHADVDGRQAEEQPEGLYDQGRIDRKSVVVGESVSVSVVCGGRRFIKKKKKET